MKLVIFNNSSKELRRIEAANYSHIRAARLTLEGCGFVEKTVTFYSKYAFIAEFENPSGEKVSIEYV